MVSLLEQLVDVHLPVSLLYLDSDLEDDGLVESVVVVEVDGAALEVVDRGVDGGDLSLLVGGVQHGGCELDGECLLFCEHLGCGVVPRAGVVTGLELLEVKVGGDQVSIAKGLPGVGELAVGSWVDDGRVAGGVGEVDLVVDGVAPVVCEGDEEGLLHGGALLEDVGDRPLPRGPPLRVGVEGLGGNPVTVEAEAALVDAGHHDHGQLAPGSPDIDDTVSPACIDDEVGVVGSLVLVSREEDGFVLYCSEDGAGGGGVDRREG